MQWIMGPLKKYADFGGRASRAEFWVFMLFVTAVTIAAHFADGARDQGVTVALNMGVLELSVTLLLLLPSITVGVRRLHDSGRSGWWMMLVYLPWLAALSAGDNQALLIAASGAFVAGGIAWIVLLLLPSQPGDNVFGPPPA